MFSPQGVQARGAHARSPAQWRPCNSSYPAGPEEALRHTCGCDVGGAFCEAARAARQLDVVAGRYHCGCQKQEHSIQTHQ